MADIKTKPITVIGAGSFGTALGILLARNGNRTRLWGRDPQQMHKLREQRVNQKYLPDIAIPDQLDIYHDFAKAVDDIDTVLISTPSHTFSEILLKLQPLVKSSIRIAWASKGLEPETGEFLQTRVEEIFGSHCSKAILSGPTFASELALASPTAITLASDDIDFAMDLSERLVNESFRVYLSTDLKGVQLGGVLKNIVAIGAGISDGLGFGANARTALITRGLAEMVRLGEVLGGFMETFNGMAGLGDLVLSCTDDQSRNRRFGLALGKGASVAEAASQIGQVVEGVRNTKEVYRLAQKLQVDMPICHAVFSIIYEKQDPKIAARELMSRTLKVEGD